MKPSTPNNVFALAVALIESAPIEPFAFQVMQHVSDMDKGGMPYDIEWFTLDDIRRMKKYSRRHSDYRMPVKKAIELLRHRSDAFELCDPVPTRDLVITPNSVSWHTFGVEHERLV